MDRYTEMSLDDFYDLPVSRIVKKIDSKGFKTDHIEYPKPTIGKTYRNPNVLPKTSRTVNLTTVIGFDKIPHPEFPQTGKPVIKTLHIEERRVYVKTEKE